MDSNSGIPSPGSDSISQPEEAEKTTGGRVSTGVRNVPKEFPHTESPSEN
jgi:hypothetical protein